MRVVLKFVVLMSTWLVWSGIFEPLTMGFGVASCITVVFFSERMRATQDIEETPFTFWVKHVGYLPWLVKEIVVSNLHVAKIILSPDMPIRPRVLKVKCTQNSDMAKVVYANSITLTPGTVTLDLREDTLLVHALTQNTADGLLTGEMDARVTRMES